MIKNIFKWLVSWIVAVSMALWMTQSTFAYSDVPADAWFAPFANSLKDAWVFDASKEKFRPADPMTRAEFVKTVISAAWYSVDKAEDQWFNDVPAWEWFAPFVNKAVELWAVDAPAAEKDYKFGPNDNISRAAAAKIILWVFWINKEEWQVANPFTDAEWHWWKQSIVAAYALSIVDWTWKDWAEKKFNPESNVLRSEVAKMVALWVIVSDAPWNYKRFENWTSAFKEMTAEDIVAKTIEIVDKLKEKNKDPETTEPGTETWPVVNPNPAWDLEISLSWDTPKARVVPNSVKWIDLAKYDVTAKWDDVVLQWINLTRKWLWNSNDIKDVTIYDQDWRITNSRWFNSDDLAALRFNWAWYRIKAGETKTFIVVWSIAEVTTTTSSTKAWNRDAVSIEKVEDITSTSTEVIWDFPLKWNEVEISWIKWAELDYKPAWSVADVKIWETQVVVHNFKLENNSAEDEDIEVSSIALKQVWTVSEWDEITNFWLYLAWEKIADWLINWNFVTFTMKKPILVWDSKTLKFDVKADIIWWATDNVSFELNKELDIRATWMKHKLWSNILNQYWTLSSVKIEAWKLSISKIETNLNKVRTWKNDQEIWRFKVIVNAWADLEWESIRVTLENTTNSASIDSLIKAWSIELQWDWFWKQTLVRDTTATTSTWVYFEDTDLWLTLKNWQEYTFKIIADIQDLANTDAALRVKISTPDTSLVKCSWAIFCVKEIWDEKYVTDINPSQISFNTIDVDASWARINQYSLASKNTVVWQRDDLAMDFKVEADQVSDIMINDITVSAAAWTWFVRTVISNVNLYEVATNWTKTLLQSKWWSQIDTAWKVTFTNLWLKILKDQSKKFNITLDFVDDSKNNWSTLKLQIASIDIEDADWDQVKDLMVAPNVPSVWTRTITLTWLWTISLFAYDDSDSEINNKWKNILANTTSPIVASVEMKASNEEIDVIEMELVSIESWSLVSDKCTASWTNLWNIIEKYIVYWDDKKTVLFEWDVWIWSNWVMRKLNLSWFRIAETTKNIYIAVKTRKIWKDLNWAEYQWLKILPRVIKARWVSSWKDISLESCRATDGSALWQPINIVASQITDIDLVKKYSTTDITNTKPTNWDNIYAILKVTAASTDNQSSLWSTAKVLLNNLVFNITASNSNWSIAIPSATLQRLDKTSNVVAWTISWLNNWTITFNAWQLAPLWSNLSLNWWEEAYFALKLNVTITNPASTTDNSSIDIDLKDLDWTTVTPNISYYSCWAYTVDASWNLTACTETVPYVWTNIINKMYFKTKSFVDLSPMSK